MNGPTPIFKAEQCHTGGYLCNHNHRTRAAAARCLPPPPHGNQAYSMGGVLAMNDAAKLLDATTQEHDDE